MLIISGIDTDILKPHSRVQHFHYAQRSLVYHYYVSLKEDSGQIKLHRSGFTTRLSQHLKKNFRKLS